MHIIVPLLVTLLPLFYVISRCLYFLYFSLYIHCIFLCFIVCFCVHFYFSYCMSTFVVNKRNIYMKRSAVAHLVEAFGVVHKLHSRLVQCLGRSTDQRTVTYTRRHRPCSLLVLLHTNKTRKHAQSRRPVNRT